MQCILRTPEAANVNRVVLKLAAMLPIVGVFDLEKYKTHIVLGMVEDKPLVNTRHCLRMFMPQLFTKMFKLSSGKSSDKGVAQARATIDEFAAVG